MLLFRRAAALVLSVFMLTVFAEAGKVTVFAAASLKNALDEVAVAWDEANSDAPVIASYAASSALAKQIEEGAPADVFFSADLAWMDHIAKAGLIKEDTRANIAGNSIVLIGSKDSTATIDFSKPVDLVSLLNGGKLALANVESVPAGRYAKAALESLGFWTSVETSVAEAENVRAALAFVARGEAPLGIVYATDALADPSVRVIGTIPESSHPPIIYPVAVLKTSANSKADAFVTFLKSEPAQRIFAKHGFQPAE